MKSNESSASTSTTVTSSKEQLDEQHRLANEQLDEQHRLANWQTICDLFGRDDKEMREALDQAGSELDREMGVRERCFPNWIDQGKISRIDARDRFQRMQTAQMLINFMLDIAGKPVKSTGDDVPF